MPVLDDAVDGVDCAHGDHDVDDCQAAFAAEQSIGDRHDREEYELLAVFKADPRIDREHRRDERRAGVGGERPEHPRHFDPLVVDDHEGEPQHGRESEQDFRGRNRELRRGGKPQQRHIRRALESRHVVGGRIRGNSWRRQSVDRIRSWSLTGASARSAAAMHGCGINSRQAPEIAGAQTRCSHGRQGRSSISTDSVGIAGSPPRRRSRRQRRTVDADDRRRASSTRCAAVRCRRRRTAALRPIERAQLRRDRRRRNRELRGRVGPESRVARLAMRSAAARSEGPSSTRSAVESSPAASPRDQLRERRSGPAPKRVARADVHDRSVRVVRSTPAARSRAAIARVRRRVERHLDRIVGLRSAAVPGHPANRRQQLPLVDDRVPRLQPARRDARFACTSSRRPGMS